VIDLQQVVSVVLMLLIAGAVFGLLFWLVTYVGAQLGEGGVLFVKAAKVVLVVLAVLFLIGVLLSLAGGAPAFRWGPGRVVL
jgi:hypothetical protein